MGIMICACTLPVAFVYFPRWGGMFRPPSKDAVKGTELDYYLSEWTKEEQSQDLHAGSAKFAKSSVSERGRRAAAAQNNTANCA